MKTSIFSLSSHISLKIKIQETLKSTKTKIKRLHFSLNIIWKHRYYDNSLPERSFHPLLQYSNKMNPCTALFPLIWQRNGGKSREAELIGSKSLSALLAGLMISTLAVQLELPPVQCIRCLADICAHARTRNVRVWMREWAEGWSCSKPGRVVPDNTSTRSSRIDIGRARTVNSAWNGRKIRTEGSITQYPIKVTSVNTTRTSSNSSQNCALLEFG